jgi:hypothetical protein
MVEYAIGNIQDIERSTTGKNITMEEETIDIVDRHIRSNEAIGPAKCGPTSDTQSDFKDGKNEGDKSATVNPAFKDGLKPVSQICGTEQSMTQFCAL